MIDILARLLNGLLMLIMPLGLAILFRRRIAGRWALYGAGALTFIGSQVLHVPFNALILNPWLATLGFGERGLSGVLVFSAAVLGLSSGVSEEGARFLVLRFWQRAARSWREALMFGAGHGGAEAIVVGLFALAGFFQAVAYRGADLSQTLPPEQLSAASEQLEAYWAAPWPEAMLGAVERAFSLVVHLVLSVMVMRAVTEGRKRWLAAAVGWHALVNCLAVTAFFTVSPAATEAVIGLTAIASLGIIFGLRENPGLEASVIGQSLPSITPAQVRPAAANLEDSKYVG